MGRRHLRGRRRSRRPSSSSAAAWAGSSPASGSTRPGCPSRSSRRTAGPGARGGRTGTPERGSTWGATSTASPSSPRTTGASTTARQPELRAYFDTIVDKYGLRSALPVRHHRDRGDAGTRNGRCGAWRCAARTAPRTRSMPDSSSARSGRSTCPGCPRSTGMDTFAGPSFHSARWPRGPRHQRDEVRPRRRRSERVSDRAGDRTGGRATDHLPAHGSVDHPESAVPRRRAARATNGRCATCPSMGAGTGSS